MASSVTSLPSSLSQPLTQYSLKRTKSFSNTEELPFCEVTLISKDYSQNSRKPMDFLMTWTPKLGRLIQAVFSKRGNILKNSDYHPFSPEQIIDLNRQHFDDGKFIYQATKFPRARAVLNPKPIGSVMLSGKDKQKKGEVFDLAVDEKYRRKGVASALMNKLIQDAKQWGYKSLHLSTEGEEAIQFYEKLGFVRDKSYKNNPNPYWFQDAQINMLKMHLNLQKESTFRETLNQKLIKFSDLLKSFSFKSEESELSKVKRSLSNTGILEYPHKKNG